VTVVLLVIFVWPILSGLFGFASTSIGDLESDAKAVFFTAEDVIAAGVRDAEEFVNAVAQVVISVACALFHIDCPAPATGYGCCQGLPAESLAFLVVFFILTTYKCTVY